MQFGTNTNEQNKWTTEETCKLIELYRESPILWDAKNLYHKNKSRMDEIILFLYG